MKTPSSPVTYEPCSWPIPIGYRRLATTRDRWKLFLGGGVGIRMGISYGYQTKGVAWGAMHIVIKTRGLKVAFFAVSAWLSK
jgi:hypothetical protein